jgi:hypothetical protein
MSLLQFWVTYHTRRMAAIAHPDDLGAQTNYLFDQAAEYYEQGDTQGDNASLLVAIAAHRELLLEKQRERVPLTWALTQTNLGKALFKLGERESGTCTCNYARCSKPGAIFRAMRQPLS